MAQEVLATIRVRQGLASEWASVNPVLLEGEPGLETDTGIVKFGDGVTAWADLPHSPTFARFIGGSGSFSDKTTTLLAGIIASQDSSVGENNDSFSTRGGAVVIASQDSKSEAGRTAVMASSLSRVGESSTSAYTRDSAVMASRSCFIDSRGQSLIAASTSCTLGSRESAVIASTGCSQTGPAVNSLIAACSNCDVGGGDESAIIASDNSSAAGGLAFAAACRSGASASGSRSVMLGANGGEASGTSSGVFCCDGGEASSTYAVAVGCRDSKAGAVRSGVYTSEYTDVTGSDSVALAAKGGTSSSRAEVTGGCSALIGCRGSSTKVSHDNAVVVASNRHESTQDYALEMGNLGDPTFVASSETGDLSIAGTLTDNASFGDYAEMFKNAEGVELGPGTLLTLEGDGVRVASNGDEVVGVVSETAGVVVGASEYAWHKKQARDEWGRKLWRESVIVEVESEDGEQLFYGEDVEPPEDVLQQEGVTVSRRSVRVPVLSKDYDPDREYVPRMKRPGEWVKVGLVGQVLVRVRSDVRAGDHLRPSADGIGSKAHAPTSMRVMRVESAYDGARGFAIALVFMK